MVDTVATLPQDKHQLQGTGDETLCHSLCDGGIALPRPGTCATPPPPLLPVSPPVLPPLSPAVPPPMPEGEWR